MELRERTIKLFSDEDDMCPFIEWIQSLDDVSEARINARLLRLQLGSFGDAKRIQDGDGVWELRFDLGPGYRVYFGLDGNTIVLLLTGGDKSTQKKDIKKAKDYWYEYKNQKNSQDYRL